MKDNKNSNINYNNIYVDDNNDSDGNDNIFNKNIAKDDSLEKYFKPMEDNHETDDILKQLENLNLSEEKSFDMPQKVFEPLANKKANEIKTNIEPLSNSAKKRNPNIKIIIVTSMPLSSWLRRAREIGVDSFWYKEAQKEPILAVMERTMAGESIYPDQTPTVQIGYTNNHDFTERELEILRELISGDSNAEIGERLGIGASTVKYHVQNMLEKTGMHTRTELAAVARSLGIAIK